MKLALRLGKTLSELDSTMPASEFYLWVGFDRISPIGDERLDIHAALISSSIYQSQGTKATLNDCLIKFSNQGESNDKLEQFESLLDKMAGK